MLLIYTHKITPRFSYIMKQIFTRILGIDVSFTITVEDFIKHSGPKITYTKQPLQNEFFVRNNDLLFEQGINDLKIKIEEWDGTPCFFRAGEGSTIPFDIFSASFYLLSRYEEYLPHIKDVYGRFPPTESLAYKQNFLRIPVVDIWAFKLLDALKARFKNLTYQKRDYNYTSIIDVTTSHCFAYRGLVRGLAGFILDIGTFRLGRAFQRVVVGLGLKKDPYDNFDELIAMHKTCEVKSMFFFQFAEYSTYDKNVSINNNKFRYLIKSVADYSIVSLAASYGSSGNIDLLLDEKKQLSGVVNRSIDYSRLRYNKVTVPVTYRNLVSAEFTNDYTMGYTHEVGFRAGTCTPFFFYDIPLELQLSIKIHSFAAHDYALKKLQNKVDILTVLNTLSQHVKDVQGEFITIFSNELLGTPYKINWLELYRSIIHKYHV